MQTDREAGGAQHAKRRRPRATDVVTWRRQAAS